MQHFGRSLSAAVSALREWSVAARGGMARGHHVLHGSRAASQAAQLLALRRMCSAMASGASAVAPGGGGASGFMKVGTFIGVGGGATMMAVMNVEDEEDATQSAAPSSELSTDHLPWLAALVQRDGVEEVLSPGQMLRRHPVAKMLVDQDHLFETMLLSGQVRSFRCFYDPAAKEFHSVVALGRDVCGFPQTVHGGLTAAISDETFGGLGVCMWRSGALGFRPPAYTARLEVDYRRKIPAGSVLVTTTRVEKIQDRKIWMTAIVSDGDGTTYATARALFVAPRMKQVLLGWVPGFGSAK